MSDEPTWLKPHDLDADGYCRAHETWKCFPKEETQRVHGYPYDELAALRAELAALREPESVVSPDHVLKVKLGEFTKWETAYDRCISLEAENESLRAEITRLESLNSAPRECPSDLDHDGMLLFLYAHFAGTEFDGSELFCPRCGQPLSSPVKEQ